MPRTARFLKERTCYHVIAHGNHSYKIFSNDADYRAYCGLLRRYKKKFSIQIFAFCLMPQAVHLVVLPRETGDLSLFMQRVSQAYSLYFNQKHRRAGRLWQGRFKSVALDRDEDLFECIKLVEFSPVREDITYSPVEYPWSSCGLRILGYRAGLLDGVNISRGNGWPSSSPNGRKKNVSVEPTVP